MRNEKMNDKARYIKTVVFNSLNDVDKIEATVNGTIDRIKALDGKIISIVPQSFGISPMHLIYNLIYESDHDLTVELTEKAGKK